MTTEIVEELNSVFTDNDWSEDHSQSADAEIEVERAITAFENEEAVVGLDRIETAIEYLNELKTDITDEHPDYDVVVSVTTNLWDIYDDIEQEPQSEDSEQTIQEQIAEAMPPIPEDRRDDDSDIRMTRDEQDQLYENIDMMVQTLYDKGYSPNDLGVIFRGFAHRMNAARCDPYEYDRIALSLELRRTIENWREKQAHDVPEREVAETVEELGRVYRTNARKETYQDIGRREAEEET